MIASIASSCTRTTRPRCESTSSACARCVSFAFAPAEMPAIPSCTVDGAFGIARTTGTPSAIRSSMRLVVIAAATERTVCSIESSGPISSSRASMSCGFTATTTIAAPLHGVGVRGRRLDVVALVQLGDALRAPRGDDDVAPARAQQARRAALRRCGRAPMIAMRSIARRLRGCEKPREWPASRYMLARPAHSPYGSSSSAVSQPSTGRPRSARRSLTRPRSPTRP